MTRKDYELIAEVLRNSDEVADLETLTALVEMFADRLEDENPRFNRETFFRKSGINPQFTERMFTPEGNLI
jgi:hypothetical protein